MRYAAGLKPIQDLSRWAGYFLRDTQDVVIGNADMHARDGSCEAFTDDKLGRVPELISSPGKLQVSAPSCGRPSVEPPLCAVSQIVRFSIWSEHEEITTEK